MKTLTGPFKQLIKMTGIPAEGPAGDDQLDMIRNGGILTEEGFIIRTGNFEELIKTFDGEVDEMTENLVLLPGFIDAHTHACWAGTRARDYNRRISGSTYQEILQQGGGIHDTVDQTRNATPRELYQQTSARIRRHFRAGITTIEIKSGYGLNVEDELKMLEVIRQLNNDSPPDLVPTCLAAHVVPEDSASKAEYLQFIVQDLLPEVRKRNLSGRIDIFIEKDAFSPEESYRYLTSAKKMGFGITIHADQFTLGGSEIAARTGAISADHLEAIDDVNIGVLSRLKIVQTVLPGASIGLGMSFAPARKILDAGGILAIASDWNPGSAPMGDLLTEAAILSAYEKLTFAETMAGLTCRAARALSLSDRGLLEPSLKADLIAFPTDDYREILYHQGRMKPEITWKNGIKYEKNKDHEKTTD